MKRLQQVASALLTLAAAAAVGAGTWWLVTAKSDAAKADKPPPPAVVSRVVKEEELNRVVLTEEAEKRLGLTVGTVQTKAARRSRVYGGEVTVPIGKAVLVAAPLGGTLKAPATGTPAAGQFVKKGQAVLQLLPLMTPEGRTTAATALVDAEGQVKSAQSQLDLARIALDRATKLLKEEAGSQRNVDEAKGAFEVASRTLAAVNERQAVLARVVGEAEGGTAVPIPISTPQDGLLRTVSALPGQTVPGGGPLFEVVDLSTVWVRVPLPVGDLDEVVRTEPARVGKLSAAARDAPALAKPVAAPPSANPLSATVDAYYELPNPAGHLTPGQRVGVTVPLADTAEGLTVPAAAVVFDTSGGAWVYERAGPRAYVRRRVVVRSTTGPDAVLAGGPAAGTTVVTAGAQELFGAETGFVK